MSHREHDDPSTRDADAAIDRAWREASAQVPPQHVDATILAAARDAIARRQPDATAERLAKPLSRTRWTWRPLLAAAAVAGVAFAILPSLLRQADRPVQPRAERGTNVPAAAQPVQPQADARVPAPAGPAPVAPATMPVAHDSRARKSTETAAAARSAESAAPTMSQDATADDLGQSASPLVPAPSAAAAESPITSEPAPVAGGSGALARADRALPSAPAALSKSPAVATPTDRAVKIAALYESGDVTAAAAELRAFRATRPDADAFLPSTMQHWARTVK